MAKLTFNTLGPSPLPQTVIDDPNFALVTPSADFYEQTVEVLHTLSLIAPVHAFLAFFDQKNCQ